MMNSKTGARNGSTDCRLGISPEFTENGFGQIVDRHGAAPLPEVKAYATAYMSAYSAKLGALLG